MGKMKEHYFEEISAMYVETIDHDALDALTYTIDMLFGNEKNCGGAIRKSSSSEYAYTGDWNKIERPVLHIGNMDENSTKK